MTHTTLEDDVVAAAREGRFEEALGRMRGGAGNPAVNWTLLGGNLAGMARKTTEESASLQHAQLALLAFARGQQGEVPAPDLPSVMLLRVAMLKRFGPRLGHVVLEPAPLQSWLAKTIADAKAAAGGTLEVDWFQSMDKMRAGRSIKNALNIVGPLAESHPDLLSLEAHALLNVRTALP